MEIKITGRNLEITENIKAYVNKKVSRLSRHMPNIGEANMELADEKTRAPEVRFVAQVTLNCDGTLLRGEDRQQNLFASIDGVVEVIDRQIEKYKGKLYKKNQAHVARKKSATEGLETIPETTSEEPQIVRVKRFDVKPMTPEDAVDQMEYLGHDFFFFMNSLTSKYNVVYLRKDGKYGLIEPD